MQNYAVNSTRTKLLSPVALRIANVSLDDALWLTRGLTTTGVRVLNTPRGKSILKKLRETFFGSAESHPETMQMSH